MKRISAIFALFCMNGASGFSQTNAEFFCNSASNDFFAGRYSAAVTNLTAEIVLNPGDYNAYLHRGMSKYWLRDYTGAVADYDKAIQLNPQCGGFYCNRGQSKFALNDMKGALADYNKAIELDPKMAIAYFNRGQLKYCADQNYSGAIADFTKAIELHTDPQEDDIFFARANTKVKLQDFAGAIADFTKTIELNPTNEQAHTSLVLAQKALRDSNKRP
jgi:tetratricopeptide (TPR) repeat protein